MTAGANAAPFFPRQRSHGHLLGVFLVRRMHGDDDQVMPPGHGDGQEGTSRGELVVVVP